MDGRGFRYFFFYQALSCGSVALDAIDTIMSKAVDLFRALNNLNHYYFLCFNYLKTADIRAHSAAPSAALRARTSAIFERNRENVCDCLWIF